jgi:hypothetical protein
MDIGAILIGLALLIVVAFIVAQPLLGEHASRVPELGEADRLKQERDQLLATLRDLDFDYALGKILEEDYTPMRADLVGRGATVLKQLEAAGPASASHAPVNSDSEIEKAIAARRESRPKAASPAAQPPTALDDDIEHAIAARRHSPSKTLGPACPHCGAPTGPDDRFCPRCGATLQLSCPHCGTAAQAGDQFCAKCGTKLPTTPSEVSA